MYYYIPNIAVEQPDLRAQLLLEIKAHFRLFAAHDLEYICLGEREYVMYPKSSPLDVFQIEYNTIQKEENFVPFIFILQEGHKLIVDFVPTIMAYNIKKMKYDVWEEFGEL